VPEQLARVRGADRVAATMHAAADDLATMDAATREYGKLLAAAAQGFAPVRTGRLRASIALRGAAVSATVAYAAPVEARSRYMARAVDRTAGDADRVFTAGAADICDQIQGV
jgi:ribosomal protein S6E (S10)